MKPCSSRAAFLAVSLAAVLPARAAFAQGGTTAEPETPNGAAAPEPATTNGTAAPEPASGAPVNASGPSGATATTPAPAGVFVEPPTSATSGLRVPPVEILPPSAYPDPRTGVRGIVGGSLWLEPDLQGMQWPYYPTTGLGISGSGWVDTSIRKYHAGEAVSGMPGSGLGSGEAQGTQFLQQSRFVLRATPTWTFHDQNLQRLRDAIRDRVRIGEFFVQAQMELVAAQINTSNGVAWSADDAWIRFGMWNKFDILLGRFQAWEVYHYGMGLDLYSVERTGAIDKDPTNGIPQIYGVDKMYQRQDVLGQGAVHLYPFDWLRFEVGFQYGANGGLNTAGVRPVGIADFPIGHVAVVRLKAGAEFVESRPQVQGGSDLTALLTNGYGGALQVIFDPYLEFGANGAWSWDDQRDNQGRITPTGRDQRYSVGGFANARIVKNLLIGGGVDYTYRVDTRYDPVAKRNENYDQLQPFGSIQYLLWDHLFLKAVFAYAKSDSNPDTQQGPVMQNEMWSARLRLLYLL